VISDGQTPSSGRMVGDTDTGPAQEAVGLLTSGSRVTRSESLVASGLVDRHSAINLDLSAVTYVNCRSPICRLRVQVLAARGETCQYSHPHPAVNSAPEGRSLSPPGPLI
jgi:hypothetical protein